MKTQIPFAVSTNQGRYANASKLVNLFPEQLSQDGKTSVVLHGTPGLKALCQLPTSPVLGLIVMQDVLYAATPTAFYKVKKGGGYEYLGEVDLSDRVSMATNGSQIVMVDGKKGYAYDGENVISLGIEARVTVPRVIDELYTVITPRLINELYNVTVPDVTDELYEEPVL